LSRVDALANPAFQRSFLIALATIAGVGAVMFLAALWTARRSASAQARVRRRRIGAVGLFAVVTAGAGYAVLSLPVDPGASERARTAPIAPDSAEDGEDVVTSRRFSSPRLPALTLDAPDGWTLALDEKAHRLNADGAGAHMSVSTAILIEAVDVPAMLRQLAETQRALGFAVGDTFTDRIGDLPAAGFLASGPARSVCTWMIKRDTRLATSVLCTADGKVTARDACKDVLTRIRWRAPRHTPR
jgi:hypothetical protein